MEYYTAMRKKEILPFATTWMALEGVMLSEINQTEKDKYSMMSILCGILKSQTRRNREQDGAYQRLGHGKLGRCC